MLVIIVYNGADIWSDDTPLSFPDFLLCFLSYLQYREFCLERIFVEKIAEKAFTVKIIVIKVLHQGVDIVFAACVDEAAFFSSVVEHCTVEHIHVLL